VEDNFLTQMGRESTSKGTPLDLLFTNSGLVSDVMVGGLLGHSDHEWIVFDSWRSKQSSSQNCYRRAEFGLVDRVPWEAVLKGKAVQEGWTLLKEILKAQEQAVPMCQKTRQRARGTAWLNRELWLELQKKISL